jgi:methylated-DNA-[protein]-cysteine S-methyltransferase
MKYDPLPLLHRASSPWGDLLLAATDQGLCSMWFAQGQKHLPDMSAWPTGSNAHITLAQAQLAEYFAGQRRVFDVPLDLRAGTAFQQSVWRAILAIPMGQVVSYGSIAHSLNNPAAVRAVGAATGRNPVGIIVPCHRVVGATGALTGYAGGIDRKIALLQLEGASTAAPQAHTAPKITNTASLQPQLQASLI